MKQARRRLRTLALVLVALTLEAQPKPAEACGGFFSAKLEERPSLAYEQTLIVYDAQKSLEHFVREVVFDKESREFGFVVPTPGRPEVFPVLKNPFKDLNERFPLFPPMRGGLTSAGAGFGGGKGGGGVEVLETKRVGSFKAFVLATRPWRVREMAPRAELYEHARVRSVARSLRGAGVLLRGHALRASQCWQPRRWGAIRRDDSHLISDAARFLSLLGA